MMNIPNLPLISVCVPAYNHEKYVEECLHSIINQTYPNLELILIDDGSTDGTWAKVQGMKDLCDRRFTRVLFISQENQGTCKTFKKLFDLAQGEYIALCASDDKFLPKALDKLYNFLKDNQDVSLTVGENLIIDSDSTLCYWDKNRKNIYQEQCDCYKSFTDFIEKDTKISITSSKYGEYESLIKGNHIANGWLFRKEILETILPFTTEAPLEDWWFMLQVSKISKIKAIRDETFCYRWHGKNTIIQSEKITKFGYLTLQCEERHLLNNGDYIHLQVLRRIKCFKKTLFKIGNLIELFVERDLYKKQKVIKVLNSSVILKEKKFP